MTRSKFKISISASLGQETFWEDEKEYSPKAKISKFESDYDKLKETLYKL